MRQMDLRSDDVTSFAGQRGSGGLFDGSGPAARLSHPDALASDLSGNLYVPDYNNHAIRKVTPSRWRWPTVPMGRPSGQRPQTSRRSRWRWFHPAFTTCASCPCEKASRAPRRTCCWCWCPKRGGTAHGRSLGLSGVPDAYRDGPRHAPDHLPRRPEGWRGGKNFALGFTTPGPTAGRRRRAMPSPPSTAAPSITYTHRDLRARIPVPVPPPLLDFQNRRSSSLRYSLTQFDDRFAAVKHAAHSRPARSEYFTQSRVRRVAAGHQNDLWWRSMSRNEG